jgi:NADH-quinone oxidoreductase subunit L
MIHAFFKALLFLSAGAVIVACHHEQDILKMGGLRKQLPLVYICFLIGGAALAALPLTSGFVSKDEILWMAYVGGKPEFVVVGLAGALLTAMYTFRLIFTVFHGEQKITAHAGHGVSHVMPLVILLVLSTFAGALIQLPLNGVLPEPAHLPSLEGAKHWLEIVSVSISLSGIAIAAFFFLGGRQPMAGFFAGSFAQGLRCLWKYAWGFDWLYDKVFVKPYMTLVKLNSRDVIDVFVESIPVAAIAAHRTLSATQNGRVRWYAVALVSGAIAILAMVLWV